MIAEGLHKMVWEVAAMPFSEYMGWIAYFESKEKGADSENLLNMDQDKMIGKLTGG